ncbi:MAG: multidrug ABC transporter substrate-binding protein [Candidatus Niyogibacteria bacterium CG10_big_fil_rev_8_21_14_0_10_42_19]|uniref:Multidrug ABC transporter substrate-binding protein n=1 Tax=Candidatus Niyogibacteria bacterium CG10_big_fil_rev_8_21_14_0_10_42_19 TaxID=1974725 RepID=A0A2H0TG31_9BACT|nr:MAG: multidrug ABC transporter substrate-binding protein [Candidatus Niyogibacteria bacterium CG10_big_fil_rev_8_21_14_0_10_42_19]
MKLTTIFKTAGIAIFSHKSRSILTVIGIVIGVTSIIVIMSVGEGATKLITNEITSLGADIIYVEPGREPKGPTDISGYILSKSLKEKDLEALRKKSNVPGIKKISPSVIVPGSISYGGETFRPMISGSDAQFFGEVLDVGLQEGYFYDDIAIRNREAVAVIGARVKDELFGESDALNKIIKINNKSFKVVGILEKRGQVFFFDMDTLVLIPYTTARTYLLGIDHYNEFLVQVEDVEQISATVEDIKMTIRESHGITDPEKDDFHIMTQESLLGQINSIFNILTTALAVIVAISLVVGGIGVMNIMLVSVTERTREIGLRKALGATEKDIIIQFVMEAVILTLTGGIIGIILGGMISLATAISVSQFAGLNWRFTLPTSAVLIGFLSSISIGLIFGIYPARQAAKMHPVEALRYE